MYRGVFSEFELEKMGVKFPGDESFLEMNCVGSSEETLDTKIVTKKCRGVTEREKVRGTGTGKLVISAHVPVNIYNKMYNMNREGLVEGARAYGKNSVHPEFAITQTVVDEDDAIKLKAYPRCIMESGPTRPITNGAEEVAELNMTISILPDADGECMYEAFESEIEKKISEKWMSEFTPDLLKVQTASETPIA